MNVWNGIGSYPEGAPQVVASIGNYDGVHLGHREILRRVVSDARQRGIGSMLVTFEPHPLSVVLPDRRPTLLQTRRQKLASLRETGLTDLLILDFTSELAALSGQEFFRQWLGDRVRFAAIHVGENFRFGHDRLGNVDLLRKIGAGRGFEVHGVPPVEIDQRTVSSSAIRRALAEGDVELARRLLGRPFAVVGEVVHGDGRGREMQCPTANLELDNDLVVRHGVYVTETTALATRFPSVTNVGVRPTIRGEGSPVVETHLLDCEEDLYHERVSVHFLARLRDEIRFDSISDLADQIARDRAAAEAFFQNQRLTSP